MNEAPLPARYPKTEPLLGRRRSRTSSLVILLALTAAAVTTLAAAVRADHVGINVPGGRFTRGIALIIGPVSSPVASSAVVTFDLSASPQLVGTGPIGGTPVILFEVGARRVGGFRSVELRATVPAFLQSGANQIPFSDISWTSVIPSGAGYTNLIPSGTFAAGSQLIHTLNPPNNAVNWMGGELTFRFANNVVYPAGTYGGASSGVVTYTANMLP